MYKSILGRPLAEKITRGAYIDDFNIGQLISRAQSLYGGEDIRALYLDVPTDKETIAYGGSAGSGHVPGPVAVRQRDEKSHRIRKRM